MSPDEGSDSSCARPLPPGLKPDVYEYDEDGLVREIVGPWAKDKYARLRKYVDISGVGVRRKWLQKANSAGATFIDLYSGPGRVRIRQPAEVLDGGPLVVWRQALESKSSFTQVYLGDADGALVNAAGVRLKHLGAPIQVEVGESEATVDRILPHLNKYALHFAFLDPYSLGQLPFEVIRKLAQLERMDILIHVSVQDLQRNLRTYAKQEKSPLDRFAPGWREHVGDLGRSDEYIRGRIMEHWRVLLKSVRMDTAEVHPLVIGSNNQPLYWLAFAARHNRALEFWEKIRDLNPEPQGKLGF